MNKSLSSGQQWARQMAYFARVKDLSSREIEERTDNLVTCSETAELSAVIKVLLTELLARD
ncbi:hypothetical protein [Serratia sp. NFX21]|uniref:hypothetical protein n=1 Tax=Serratia sp. NFX21 TaxID=3402279 RepID=UPI003AF37EEF